MLERYPNLVVGRPCRLLETVKRIVIPTRPLLRGDAKLHGSPLATYRKRIWKPCVRNVTAAVSVHSPFIGTCSQCRQYLPELLAYGLNKELFMSCFQAFESETSLPWQMKGIPDVGFYKALHPYFTKFKANITKITIGKFYIAIDPNLSVQVTQAMNS